MRTARIAPVLRCEHNHGEITISGNVVCMDDGQRTHRESSGVRLGVLTAHRARVSERFTSDAVPER